jgi:hypothetical protein
MAWRPWAHYIELFAGLGWQTNGAFDEVFGEGGFSPL